MNIGLIAHDSKKKLMQNFCIAYRGILCKNELYATGTTGRLVEEVTNLNVHKFLAGHLGGEHQMGAQIENNQIDLMIFLRNPMGTKPHEEFPGDCRSSHSTSLTVVLPIRSVSLFCKRCSPSMRSPLT